MAGTQDPAILMPDSSHNLRQTAMLAFRRPAGGGGRGEGGAAVLSADWIHLCETRESLLPPLRDSISFTCIILCLSFVKQLKKN